MAGLNIPKREQLENGPKLSDLNKARLKAQDRLSDYAERAAVKGADLAFGEDTGDSLLEDLAYGAVPFGSLFQRAKTGTRPGLLDFADFIPGSGALKAMLPIAVKPTLDAMKAGKRMGKTSRNLDVAKNPYVERWHRTKASNAQSIGDKGLLIGKDNPNYGRNTGDANDLQIPVNWLANNPTNIPVLQYAFTTDPTSTVTYRVKIPKDIYYDTPRLKFRSGRRGSGTHDTYIVGKKESSLTGERGRQTGEDAMIDLFGASIPPEWLEKIPNDKIEKYSAKKNNLLNYIDDMGEDPVDWPLSKAGSQLATEDLNWLPFHDRIYYYKKMKDVGERVSKNIARMPNYPPSEHLRDALRYFYPLIQRGKMKLPAYGYGMFDDQTRNLPSDVSRRKGKFETHTRAPKSLFEYTIPTDEQVQVGTVSRGLGSAYGFKLKDRVMNWDKFNKHLASGNTPYGAMLESKPDRILVDTPDGLKTRTEYGTSAGHISRGNSTMPMTMYRDSRPDELLKELKRLGGTSADERAEELQRLMRTRSNEDGYTL